MAKVTSREVWGMIEAANRGEDRLTSMGMDLDRSRYASSSDDGEPPALRHSRGKESNVVRHCWQTAVALTRSRSFARKAVVRARVSGGIWLMGAKQFLRFLALLSIVEILETVSSICTETGSATRQLQPLRRRPNLFERCNVGPTAKGVGHKPIIAKTPYYT